MRKQIERLLEAALQQLHVAEEFAVIPAFIQVDAKRDKQHGDFATNIALILAKPENKPAHVIAEKIIQALPVSPYIEKVEIAGPGFINFFLSPQALAVVVQTILTEKNHYGRCKIGRGKRILVEFVSANPTGPLHIGHGRHAAYGDVVANLLQAVGFKPYREYYINDAGRQMDVLAVSIWLRYLELTGEEIIFPAEGYHGNYIIEIAKKLQLKYGNQFQIKLAHTFFAFKNDNKEIEMNAFIADAKEILGGNFQLIASWGSNLMLQDIREDLSAFGVRFDNWFSEQELVTADSVNILLEKLNEKQFLYEEVDAIWFRASQLGDEKDRMLIRANKTPTYFANDAAYHLTKFERGFDIALDIFGADHHGYVPRMKAIIEAAGIDAERLIHLLGQFVTLYRHGQQVQMSIRSGDVVTLRELRQEVGNDAARFFYVMRKYDQHIDFDLDLAKSQSNDNPVFYVQYAYARICSVFKQLKEKNLNYQEEQGLSHLHLLTAPQERQLLNTLSRYPDIIVNAALHYEPHLLTIYLRDLAADFHTYYNAHPFIVEEEALRHARLALILAIQQTLQNGFSLLGITAPESM